MSNENLVGLDQQMLNRKIKLEDLLKLLMDEGYFDTVVNEGGVTAFYDCGNILFTIQADINICQNIIRNLIKQQTRLAASSAKTELQFAIQKLLGVCS